MTTTPAPVQEPESSVLLVRYDTMCRAIDAAYEVDEVKEIRDRAAALEHYSRQAHNTEAERRCCEIRLRAERKAGEILAKTEKAKGTAGLGRPSLGTGTRRSPISDAPTLAQLGITPDQSSDWQKLAEVPEEQFEAALSGEKKPTTTGIIRAAFPPEPKKADPESLWLWGRLREIEERGYLDDDLAGYLDTMEGHMVTDVRRIAPKMLVWLQWFLQEERCQEAEETS